MTKLTQLRQSEWLKIEAKATQRYKTEHLGAEPTWQNTAPQVPHSSPTTIITWGAIALLIALLIFTAFKSIEPAIQFADSFTSVNSLSPSIASAFRLSSIAVAVMITTMGLPFTTIQSVEKVTLQAQKDHPIKWWGLVPYNILSLEVLTPQLWQFLTYAVIVWLFIISSHGDGDDFMKYLPVFLEVALAHTVKDVIQNFRIRHSEVYKVWEIRHKQWILDRDSRFDNAFFLRILFQEMREALTLMKRGRKRPNAWLDTANGNVVLAALTQEYNRLMAGFEFASALTQKAKKDKGQAHKINALNPKLAYELRSNCIPPNGATFWTPESLKLDFAAAGLDREMVYTEAMLNKEYAGNHRARAAFRGDASKRDGAKFYFNGRE